jgi:hypothetical protein
LTAPYRLFFWSNENTDSRKPPHVHVSSGDGYAEFWLRPVRIKEAGSYNDVQRARARKVVEEFEAQCLEAWERIHGDR